MTIAPILRATHVHRQPAEAFALFTDRIGAWWPLRTHGLFGDRSAGLSFDGGQLVERSLDGEQTTWGAVLAWEPPTRLAFTWHPGRSADAPASEVEVTFHPEEEGTRVELIHRGWEHLGDDGPARRDHYVGPNTWGAVLDHFTDIADKLAPTTDLTALATAYDEFFAEALVGGFGPPPSGEWSAEEVVAHIAINDDGLGSICRGLIDGAEMRYDNDAATDPVQLAALTAGHTLLELIAIGRHRSQQLMTLLARLNEQQLATAVHCRLRDGGELVVDAPMPWGRLLLNVQPDFHLSGHTRQLRELRTR